MLSKVLEKSTCAECRFCCSFRRCSLWETPLFPMETVDKLSKDNEYNKKVDFVVCGAGPFSCGQMELTGKYQTEDAQEEAACEFLDPQRGCILSAADKPFDCKIWPLRIMKKDEALVIALTPTCPAISRQPLEVMQKLVEDGLGQQIYEYAKGHPFIIKDYKEGFPVLMQFE